MEVKIVKLDDQGEANKKLETTLELKLKEMESLKAKRRNVETENESLSDAIKKLKATLRYSLIPHSYGILNLIFI